MTDHQPLTTQQLDEIAARATERRAALTEWINRNSPQPGQQALENAEAVLEEDVPALLADNQRLRQQLAQARAAAGESFRAEFGNVIVKGQDGDWANIADYIATGARIPACDSFYPHHTDTRCVLHKGHRGSHRAPWGTRDMAWPYDPRETQPAEETHVVADDSNDPEHIDDCPGCETAARPAATTQDQP